MGIDVPRRSNSWPRSVPPINFYRLSVATWTADSAGVLRRATGKNVNLIFFHFFSLVPERAPLFWFLARASRAFLKLINNCSNHQSRSFEPVDLSRKKVRNGEYVFLFILRQTGRAGMTIVHAARSMVGNILAGGRKETRVLLAGLVEQEILRKFRRRPRHVKERV